jgi:hypothetical protein
MPSGVVQVEFLRTTPKDMSGKRLAHPPPSYVPFSIFESEYGKERFFTVAHFIVHLQIVYELSPIERASPS